MHLSAVSIALVAATLVIAPASAAPEIYKWVEADGSVHYGNTPPARTKNVRLVGMDSGTVSVVPGMSTEEFEEAAEGARTGCPVSQALQVPISLEVTLEG